MSRSVITVLLFTLLSIAFPKNGDTNLKDGINSLEYWKEYRPERREKEVIEAVQERYEKYHPGIREWISKIGGGKSQLHEESAYRYLIANGSDRERGYAMMELARLPHTEPYFMFLPFLNDSITNLENYGDSEVQRYRYLSSLSDKEADLELENIYIENRAFYFALMLEDPDLNRRAFHPISRVVARIAEEDSIKRVHFYNAYDGKKLPDRGRASQERYRSPKQDIITHSEEIYGDSPEIFIKLWEKQVTEKRVQQNLYDKTITLFPDSAFHIRYKTAHSMGDPAFLMPLMHHLESDSAWELIKERYLRCFNYRFDSSAVVNIKVTQDSLFTLLQSGNGDTRDSILYKITKTQLRRARVKKRNDTVTEILKALSSIEGEFRKQRIKDLLQSSNYHELYSDEVYGIVVVLESEGYTVEGAEYLKSFEYPRRKGGFKIYEENKKESERVLPALMVQLEDWLKKQVPQS